MSRFTAIISPGASGSVGIGFAIPSNQASKIINQLLVFGETKRGWLGVRIQVVTEEIASIEKLEKPQGALVASVSENSPAAKGGVRAGDIILEFDGKEVETMRDLPKLVAGTKVGKRVEIKIWRNKKLITKRVLLGRLESSKEYIAEKENQPSGLKGEAIQKLKISVRDINKNDISKRNLPKDTTGVVVTGIAATSPLTFLSIDDVIVELQKRKVTSVNQFSALVKDIIDSGENTLLFAIYDANNQRSYITVKLK